MISITQETVEKIREVWKEISESDKKKIKNILSMLHASINKIENITMKKLFEQILSLVETKILRNPDPNSKSEKSTSINYDKINNIIKQTETIIDPKRINSIITKIITFNKLLNDYIVKISQDEFIKSNGNIIVLFESIITDLIKLFDK